MHRSYFNVCALGFVVHIIIYIHIHIIIIIINLFYILFSNSVVSHGKLVQQCQAPSTASLCLEHIRVNLKLL